MRYRVSIAMGAEERCADVTIPDGASKRDIDRVCTERVHILMRGIWFGWSTWRQWYHPESRPRRSAHIRYRVRIELGDEERFAGVRVPSESTREAVDEACLEKANALVRRHVKVGWWDLRRRRPRRWWQPWQTRTSKP